MSKRKASAMEDNSNQRSDIAVNAAGYCLVHDWPGRKKHQVITVHGDQLEKRVQSFFTECGHADSNDETPALRHDYRILGPKELEEPIAEEGTAEWLVVGLALTPDTVRRWRDTDYLRKAREGRRNCIVGVEEPRNEDKIELNKNERAMLVVLSFAADLTKEKKLGCLLNEMDGLREAYQISQQDVFFFDEFRDSTKDKEKRVPKWWSHAYAAIEQIKEEREPGAKKRQKIAEEETIEHDEEPIVPVKEEPRPDDNAPAILQLAEPEAAMTLTIAKFIRHQEVFEREEAEQLYNELQELWPNIHNFSARDLRDLHDGMKVKGFDIDPRILYNFLVVATEVWTEHNWRISWSDLVEKSWKRASKYFYPGKTRMLQCE